MRVCGHHVTWCSLTEMSRDIQLWLDDLNDVQVTQRASNAVCK